jgi:hypothetical protein
MTKSTKNKYIEYSVDTSMAAARSDRREEVEQCCLEGRKRQQARRKQRATLRVEEGGGTSPAREGPICNDEPGSNPSLVAPQIVVTD